jgi:redox-regulated HSP33 family molecular chaperone
MLKAMEGPAMAKDFALMESLATPLTRCVGTSSATIIEAVTAGALVVVIVGAGMIVAVVADGRTKVVVTIVVAMDAVMAATTAASPTVFKAKLLNGIVALCMPSAYAML